jgi:hypothetical protein
LPSPWMEKKVSATERPGAGGRSGSAPAVMWSGVEEMP